MREEEMKELITKTSLKKSPIAKMSFRAILTSTLHVKGLGDHSRLIIPHKQSIGQAQRMKRGMKERLISMRKKWRSFQVILTSILLCKVLVDHPRLIMHREQGPM